MDTFTRKWFAIEMEQALVDHLCINELRCLPRGLPRAWVYVVCDKI